MSLQMQKNRPNDASRALIWLRGGRYDPSIELTEMQMAIQKQKETSKSVAASMMRSSSVKALSISFGLFIVQQLCGINVVIFYTTDLFEVSGSDSLVLCYSETNVFVIFPTCSTDALKVKSFPPFRVPIPTSVQIFQQLWWALCKYSLHFCRS